SPFLVVPTLGTVRLPCRNDPDDQIVDAVAMHDDEKSTRGAHTEQDEPVLVHGVFRIIDQQAVLVRKHGLGLGERDAMLPQVRGRLAGIPFDPEFAHGRMYIRHTYVGSDQSRGPSRRHLTDPVRGEYWARRAADSGFTPPPRPLLAAVERPQGR